MTLFQPWIMADRMYTNHICHDMSVYMYRYRYKMLLAGDSYRPVFALMVMLCSLGYMYTPVQFLVIYMPASKYRILKTHMCI